MKLYNSNFAPNPRRVRVFLAEKGVSIPRVEVDLAGLEHKRTRVLRRQSVSGRFRPWNSTTAR